MLILVEDFSAQSTIPSTVSGTYVTIFPLMMMSWFTVMGLLVSLNMTVVLSNVRVRTITLCVMGIFNAK